MISRVGGRERNEDACGYWTSDAGACFVVSDGAGGHGGGDVASETAVRTFLSAFAAKPSLQRENLHTILVSADEAVRYGRGLTEELREMSATITALLLDDRAEKACWTSLGDTRLYHFRRREWALLTKDHSVVQNLVDAGFISNAEVRHHDNRNMLFAALGMGQAIPQSSPSAAFDLEDGDAFLICTDGFWTEVAEAAMHTELRRAESAEEWLIRMEQILLREESAEQDNYSALAVWIGRPNEITLTKAEQAANGAALRPV